MNGLQCNVLIFSGYNVGEDVPIEVQEYCGGIIEGEVLLISSSQPLVEIEYSYIIRNISAGRHDIIVQCTEKSTRTVLTVLSHRVVYAGNEMMQNLHCTEMSSYIFKSQFEIESNMTCVSRETCRTSNCPPVTSNTAYPPHESGIRNCSQKNVTAAEPVITSTKTLIVVTTDGAARRVIDNVHATILLFMGTIIITLVI